MLVTGRRRVILRNIFSGNEDCGLASSLFDRLSQIDATILASDRPPLPPIMRRAILLAQAVNPGEGRGIDWLVPEATSTAKFIHHEQAADFTVFVFDDRSVLVVLRTGFFYAVASGNAESVSKLSAWLASHNIVTPAPGMQPATTSHALH